MKALIVGQGGIGRAFANALPDALIWSRPDVDPTDEASVICAAQALPEIDLTIVTTGILHDDEQQPERALKQLKPENMMRSFTINTLAPVQIAKHVIPKIPRDRRAVFAVLGARVGSIGDNRTGGWHSYRASKTALIMLLKNIAIETARTYPQAIIVTLHPGTVDTAMSKPFQVNVPPEKLFTPQQSVAHLLRVIDGLSPADSGGHFAWDGSRIPD